MLKSRKIKYITSIAFAVVLCVSITIPAFALPIGQRVSAFIGACILASNMTLEATVLPLQYDLQQRIDPYNIYITQVEEDYYDNLDKSTIKILPNTTIIDGVQYSDVWLSSDAINKFKTDGADFYTAYGIASNSRGTYADGYGNFDGIPLFDVNGVIRTSSYVVNAGTNEYPLGYGSIQVVGSSSFDSSYKTSDDRDLRFINSNPANRYPQTFYITKSGETTVIYYVTNALGVERYGGWNNVGQYYQEAPFDFDYVSGTIDLEPFDNGMLIRVPSTYTDPNTGTSYDIPSFVNDNPEINQPNGKTIELDPNINPDFQLDYDLLDDIGDLINTILNVLDLLNRSPNATITDSPMPETPIPPEPDPPIPEPGTTIADTDYSIYDNLLRWIKTAIDNVKNAINNIAPFVQNIDAKLQEIFDDIDKILEGLRDFFDPEWFNKLGDAIEKHAIDTFKKAINKAKQIFLPILGFIKLHLGIWHYVVEWLQSISSIFLWFFGIMSATSYNMVLPIYAVIAGIICIAIYKAFGR